MNLQNEKCVMVIDENLPLGLIANTAAIMGITLGKEMPEVVGRNVMDQDGYLHPGIIEFPVPILKADLLPLKISAKNFTKLNSRTYTLWTSLTWRRAVKHMMNLLKKCPLPLRKHCYTTGLESASRKRR